MSSFATARRADATRAERASVAMLLLGGQGRRLWPLTEAINKHLLPVYDRCLAANALTWLGRSGFREVIAVVPAGERAVFERTLAAENHPLKLTFVTQPAGRGTGDATRRAIEQCSAGQVAVMFGDNVFGSPFDECEFDRLPPGIDARCFAKRVEEDGTHFGRIDFAVGKATAQGRPHRHHSGFAMTGIFLIRRDSLLGFTSGSAGCEDDLVDFIVDCSVRGTLTANRVEHTWCDAGYSFEALWRAGELMRRSNAVARKMKRSEVKRSEEG